MDKERILKFYQIRFVSLRAIAKQSIQRLLRPVASQRHYTGSYPRLLNSKGMIMVEALLAVVILGSGITLVVQSLSASRRNVANSLEFTKAIFILENQLTQLMENKNGASEIGSDQNAQESEKYAFTLEPADSGAEDSEYLIEMKADLSWNSGRRKNSLSLNTYTFTPPNEEPK